LYRKKVRPRRNVALWIHDPQGGEGKGKETMSGKTPEELADDLINAATVEERYVGTVSYVRRLEAARAAILARMVDVADLEKWKAEAAATFDQIMETLDGGTWARFCDVTEAVKNAIDLPPVEAGDQAQAPATNPNIHHLLEAYRLAALETVKTCQDKDATTGECCEASEVESAARLKIHAAFSALKERESDLEAELEELETAGGDLQNELDEIKAQGADTAPAAGLEALEKEIVAAACLAYGTRGNSDFAPVDALWAAVSAYMLAPSPAQGKEGEAK
jgi:hypothetical protein